MVGRLRSAWMLAVKSDARFAGKSATATLRLLCEGDVGGIAQACRANLVGDARLAGRHGTAGVDNQKFETAWPSLHTRKLLADSWISNSGWQSTASGETHASNHQEQGRIFA